MKLQGFNQHRHQDNPLENKIHDKFIKDFIEDEFSHNMIDKIVYGTTDYGDARDYLSDHEKKIAISMMQWLGSHVGECFLKSVGYVRKND